MVSIIHDVKAMLQPSKSDVCGQFCARMVLDYFGIKVTMEDVNKCVRYTRGGTLDTSIAVALHKLGAQPKLFVLPGDEAFLSDYPQMPSRKVAKHLLKRVCKLKSRVLKRGYTDLSYLFERDFVVWEPPTPTVIRREILNGGVWIVGVSLESFYNPPEPGHHFVVVRGFKDSILVVNDPGKGIMEIDQELLAYSIARSDGVAICVNSQISDVQQQES